MSKVGMLALHSARLSVASHASLLSGESEAWVSRCIEGSFFEWRRDSVGVEASSMPPDFHDSIVNIHDANKRITNV
ncbi:hypothetical protein D3C87_1928590 [compost metagenome]